MRKIVTKLLGHPIRQLPYTAIRLTAFAPDGRPLFKVKNVESPPLGAAKALRAAATHYGARCFYCRRRIGGPLADAITIDHVQPRADRGKEDMHNFVIACESCNHRKRNRDIKDFDVDAARKWADALVAHLQGCVDHARRHEAEDPLPAKTARAA